MLKFLDKSDQTKSQETKPINSTGDISQRKSEQARVRKNIREWKRKTRKSVQINGKQEEVILQSSSTEENVPVEEQKDTIDEELLPVCTDPDLGSLPPPPPPRDFYGFSFEETAALYDSVFSLAESKLINVDEEAKVYKMIAKSDLAVFDSFRRYQNHKDLGKFAAELVAL